MPSNPKYAIIPVIPFGSVGEVVVGTNGRRYLIIKVDGSKAWLKHPNRDGTPGAGQPVIGLMVGDPTQTEIPEAADSSMAGKVKRDRLIRVDIL